MIGSTEKRAYNTKLRQYIKHFRKYIEHIWWKVGMEQKQTVLVGCITIFQEKPVIILVAGFGGALTYEKPVPISCCLPQAFVYFLSRCQCTILLQVWIPDIETKIIMELQNFGIVLF